MNFDRCDIDRAEASVEAIREERQKEFLEEMLNRARFPMFPTSPPRDKWLGLKIALAIFGFFVVVMANVWIFTR